MVKEYKDYIEEIEALKVLYDLGIDQVLLLQISAAFKVDNKDYEKLKEEFINAKKTTNSNNS